MSSPHYSPEFIRDCIRTALPESSIADTQVLSGGLINTNIKIEFSSNERPVVLRLYRGDSAVCLKETAVLRSVRSTVPVPEVIPRLIDQFLQSEDLQRRLDASFRQQLHDFIWSWSDELRALGNERHLVHCDFGNRNLLVNCVNGIWRVVAVLDWEFAASSSPLLDVGHFLRYEPHDASLREPYFSRAFVETGGVLPDDWRRLSQVVDLTGLVHNLTHPQLPDDVAREILRNSN